MLITEEKKLRKLYWMNIRNDTDSLKFKTLFYQSVFQRSDTPNFRITNGEGVVESKSSGQKWKHADIPQIPSSISCGKKNRRGKHIPPSKRATINSLKNGSSRQTKPVSFLPHPLKSVTPIRSISDCD